MKPELAKKWQGARVTINDVAPAHLSYPAVSAAVAAGVMPLSNGNFDLLRPRQRRRSDGHLQPPRSAGPPMTAQVFTIANQLTLLRMLLIPLFVILTLYGEFGWALAVFAFAGLTDLLDGLAARAAGQKSELGAWLDPAADKLLLVTTFIVLTLPNIGLVNRIPLWLTVLVISRDVGIVLTVAIVNLAIGPRTFKPSPLGKAATAILHRRLRHRDAVQLPRLPLAVGGRRDLGLARHHARVRRRLRLAHREDHQQVSQASQADGAGLRVARDQSYGAT